MHFFYHFQANHIHGVCADNQNHSHYVMELINTFILKLKRSNYLFSIQFNEIIVWLIMNVIL